jgi:translation elongation factor EF-4
MSNRNKGMQPYYEGLQDDDFNKKEVELIETINNILKHESDTKNINRKTKLTDNYSMPTMDSISDYLEKKYGKDSDVIVTIIRTWSKSHKDVSVSVNGWLINSVLDTFKGFVEMIKQRSFGDRMLGRNKGEKD